ncbi:MAG: rRNA maturation RNase YbeY [Deltaproteobacteria bacterium]|nr:rRNA maturation RNase YbeY [Deltaproteobacteria bacterium]
MPIERRELKRRLSRVLRDLEGPGASLTLLLADDRILRKLNRRFRRIDSPTNVLAFPAGDPPPLPPPEGDPRIPEKYLGDLAVSTETILREAGEGGGDPRFLLYFYAVHGILHLLGHDHERGKREERIQNEETERLLELIGVARI